MLRARRVVGNVPEYHPPLAGREGLRLDFNENTRGCSPRVLERLRSLTAEELTRYPERAPVEAIVARYLEVEAGQVLLTNGVDEAIHLLCETYLEPEDEVLMVTPTFIMYEIYAAATGARVMRVQCGADLQFPVAEVLDCISPATRMIAVASPNNPTGAVARREELLQIAESAPNAALLVDEAYFEFHGESVIGDIRKLDNLFVARTFSKAYGLAGLRTGMLIGPREQMLRVRRVSSPYSVNAVALAVLPAALEDRNYLDGYVAEVKAGREQLAHELRTLGWHSWPSQANFILVQIGAKHRDFVLAMRQRGILVRDRSSDPGCDGCVRITIGSDAQTERLVEALRQIATEFELAAKVTV